MAKVFIFIRDYIDIFSLLILLSRGIDVVRNKIKMFAQKKVTLVPGKHKIVILDEADRSGMKIMFYILLF